MAGQQRVYRQRIRSTQSLKKIFRAMELIAASRIGKARQRVAAATPYSEALTRALSAAATHARVDHPLLSERTDTNRVAVLLVTSDRGMAGAYSASVIREAEWLMERLKAEGVEVTARHYPARILAACSGARKRRSRPCRTSWPQRPARGPRTGRRRSGATRRQPASSR